MAYLGNTLINGSLRCLNKAYFNDLSIGSDVEIAGKTTTNQLWINSTSNFDNLVSTNSSTGNIPLIIGTPTGRHIAMDIDEIQFKNNATSNRAGFINYGGGAVYLSNGQKISANNGVFKAESLGASDSRIPNAYITTLDATTSNVTTLNASTGTIQDLEVKNVLKSFKWDISNVANLANDFMVAPTIEIATDGTVSVSKSGSDYIFTFADSNTITSDEFAGCKWLDGSKVRFTTKINDKLFSDVYGTVTGNMNTTSGRLAVKTSLTDDDLTGVTLDHPYDAVGSTIMLYAITKTGDTNIYPVGIHMTAYGTNNSYYIDMYGGNSSSSSGTPAQPVFRIGNLGGIAYNEQTLPAQWGVYTYNGYFEGAVVAKEGKIGEWIIDSKKIYTGTWGTANSAMMSPGTTSTDGNKSIGGSDSINGWTFTSGANFGVNKDGSLYVNKGKLGGWNIGSNAITNGTWGTANSAMVCTGSSSAKAIGGSESISGWTFTSGANFGVTKTGALYASDVNVTGAVNASTLHVGSSSSTNHLIYENSTIDLQTDWLKFNNNTSAVTIGKDNAPRVVIDGKSMQLKNYQDITYFNVEDLRNSDNVYHFTNEKVTCNSSGTRLTTNYTINTNYSMSVTDSNGNIVPYDRLVNNTQIEGTFIQDEIYTINYTTSDSIYRISYGDNRRSYTGANSVNLSTTGKATGNMSYCEGHYSVASGDISHAEGYYTEATGNISHAEGRYTNATGNISHAEGATTTAFGDYSHAEGCLAEASGKYSHAEGYQTKASGERSHAEGRGGTASGKISHAEGYLTEASGDYSHAEGYYTKAIGDYSHAEGYYAKASDTYSHGEGYQTVASGKYSHAEGGYAVASGSFSHAEGAFTAASGSCSHAEGSHTKAIGDYSHAEGYYVEASNDYSHGEGRQTVASGEYSHAEGRYTKASGNCSHAEGYQTTASGYYSHAGGIYTYATKSSQTVIGKYNTTTKVYSDVLCSDSLVCSDDLVVDGTTYTHDAGDYAFIIGNGTSDSNRSNALTIDWNGLVRSINPNISITSTPSSDQWIAHYNMADSTGYVYGVLQGDILANGKTGVTVQTQRLVNDTRYQNGMRLYLNSDGSPQVVVDHPEAWKNALGVNIKTYSTTITTNQYGEVTIPSALSGKTILSVRCNNYQYGCFLAGSSVRVFKISATPLAWAVSTAIPFIFIYIQ